MNQQIATGVLTELQITPSEVARQAAEALEWALNEIETQKTAR